MTNSVEVWRAYVDRATPILLDRINPQTGFYHFQLDQYSGVSPVVAPMVENFMVVLFLLRTRTHENMAKGKELLEKLLCFCVEGEREASFPRAIHEFPVPAHPLHILGMLSPLVQIKIDFSILGQQVLFRLQNIISKLFSSLENWFLEKESDSGMYFLFMLLEVVDGRRSEESFLEASSKNDWVTTRSMEDVRLLTQVVLLLERTSHKCSPLFRLHFSRLQMFFHKDWKKTCSYSFSNKYFKTEYVSSLFEYYISARLGIPIDVSYVDPFFLDLALIEPHYFLKELDVEQVFIPSECKNFSFPGLEVRAICSQPKSNERYGFFPIRLITRNSSPVISFPRARVLDIVQEGTSLVCMLESEDDALHNEQLVHLYLETSICNFSMSSPSTGKSLSYCRVGEGVVVSFDGIRLGLKIDSQEPASWSLLRGNRSGQLEKKTSSGKIGFDWLVGCSTISLMRPPAFKVTLEVL